MHHGIVSPEAPSINKQMIEKISGDIAAVVTLLIRSLNRFPDFSPWKLLPNIA